MIKEADENRKIAKAELDLAKQTLEEHTIMAPFDGIVTKRMKNPGESVRANEAVVELGNLNHLAADAYVPLEYAYRVKEGQIVEIQPRHAGRARRCPSRRSGSGARSPSSIPRSSRSAETAVRIRAEFENPGWELRPGLEGADDHLPDAGGRRGQRPRRRGDPDGTGPVSGRRSHGQWHRRLACAGARIRSSRAASDVLERQAIRPIRSTRHRTPEGPRPMSCRSQPGSHPCRSGQAAEHLQVRLRPDLVVQPQFYEGMTHYVIKDPLALKYFRFKIEEYFLLQQFDGKQTLQDVKKAFERKYRPQTISIEDLTRFVAQLHEAGIIQIDSGEQAKVLIRRRKKNRWRKVWSFLANILFIKIPIIDPERLLTRMYPVLPLDLHVRLHHRERDVDAAGRHAGRRATGRRSTTSCPTSRASSTGGRS